MPLPDASHRHHRVDLLASSGAGLVTSVPAERRYGLLAAWLDVDPKPWGVQTTKGRPPTDENEAGIEALVAVFSSGA